MQYNIGLKKFTVPIQLFRIKPCQDLAEQHGATINHSIVRETVPRVCYTTLCYISAIIQLFREKPYQKWAVQHGAASVLIQLPLQVIVYFFLDLKPFLF